MSTVSLFDVLTDNAVYDERLAGLSMEVLCTDGVDFNVLKIIDIDELFVDIRAVGSRVNKDGSRSLDLFPT